MTQQPYGRAEPVASMPLVADRAELEARLLEAEETLDAIRNGEVDAVVVGGPGGQQVYTLENADRPYRVLVEQMQEGAVTLGAEGLVLYCNQRFATIVGVHRESLIGSAVGDLFGGDERRALLGLIGRETDGGASLELTLRARNGAEVPVNISMCELSIDAGMPRVICCVVTDLTNSRRRSHELAAANARLAVEIEERSRAEASLQLALDAAGMGSWDLDLVTNVTHRSLRHDQIFGHPALLPSWSLGDVLGYFLTEDRHSVASAFARAELSGAIDLEARIRRAGDGATRWVHIKGKTYFEADRAVRIAGVVADVTERREVEERLRQALKMEAVGQLTGGIAHDFNNLLMIIGGSLDMLSRRVEMDEAASRLFDAALQGVARGARLNEQLLAFSRREELRSEVVCVDDLIGTFAHLLDRAVGEMVTVRIERASEAWLCRADPHQLEAAILNLAINARDAMPDGGTLTVTTENHALGRQAAVRHGVDAGEYLALSVADTGTGIPPDVVARAFEPFFTTKGVGKGTDLGLSQVYGFAKQSGGFVAIESEKGNGTVVQIYLPRTLDPPTEPKPPAEPVGPIAPSQGVVLLVEDDPGVRATTGGMLRELGYDVREADTARAALAVVDGGPAIDLVFSDIVMPDGMSGVDLARALADRQPGLSVLLTSGFTAHQIEPEKVGDRLRLLRKPYSQGDLSRAIREAMTAGSGPQARDSA